MMRRGTLRSTAGGQAPLSKRSPTQQSMEEQQPVLKEEVYESVDQILKNCVDEIWEMFDDDGNGLFDSEETTAFIRHTLTEMGESPDYSESDFLACFQQFTKSGRGYITKPEMMIFIKKVAGLDCKEDEDELKKANKEANEEEEEGEGQSP